MVRSVWSVNGEVSVAVNVSLVWLVNGEVSVAGEW